MEQWVAGPRGEYRVLAGKAGALRDATESPSTARRAALWFGLWAILAGAVRRRWGPGRVQVWWRDRSWGWTARDEDVALSLVPAVTELLRTGTWVPGVTPQPELPRAEVDDGF